MTTTPRARAALADGEVTVDALIFSAHDHDEARWAERLASHARVMVVTEGARGGHWHGASRGRWEAAELPGPRRDDYGCGDSFAAGFTFGLAEGLSLGEAAKVGAERGALALTIVGAP
jgi:ribokinase